MQSRTRGIFYTVLSAGIFGVTPILVRVAYDGGANGVTMACLRALLALPLLALLALKHEKTLALQPGQPQKVFWLGFIGSGLTTVLLYSSYAYIPVSMASALHFVYPLLVNLGCVVFFHERLGRLKWAALGLGAVGVCCFADPGGWSVSGGAEVLGAALALLSGGCYAFYMIYMAASGLGAVYHFKLTFYLCVIQALMAGLFGLATGQLTFRLTPRAWLFAAVVSVCVSAGAVSLLQLGVRLTGAGAAAILSVLDPITSVVCGVLVLHEQLTAAKTAGCVCIFASVLLITCVESIPALNRPRGASRSRQG